MLFRSAGLDTQAYTDKISQDFRDMADAMGVSYDDYIRTTEQRHKIACAELWKRIEASGDIYLGHYEGWYAVRDEAFYDESETALKDGVRIAVASGAPVEWVREPSYFFKLSAWQDRLLKFYEENPDFITPNSRRNEVMSFVRGGLLDLSVSRTTFNWGIPVPNAPGHVMYVWLDALTNYLTAVGYPDTKSDSFSAFWPADLHMIGKDILRFHAVFWPAMLMAAGLEPPRNVFAHGFLMVGGERMSKTRLNQIAPADLVETFGSDGFRYHFLVDQRFGPDGDFSFEQMVTRYNADLANNFGNLASRVLNMAVSYCDGAVPATRADGPLVAAAARARDGLDAGMAALDFASGFGAVWVLIGATNAYIEDRQPWALQKAGDTAGCAAVLGDCLEALRIVAVRAGPLLPRATAELWSRLGLDGDPTGARLPADAGWGAVDTAGNRLVKGDPLFPRLEVAPG